MKFIYKLFILVVVLAAVSLAPAVNRSKNTSEITGENYLVKQQTDKDKLTKLKKNIDAEIGKPKAKKSSQCKAIAFGAKPCGGPKSYLIYSTLKTREPELKRLVNEYNSLEDKINRENDLASDCMMIMEPEVILQNGMCKIKSGNKREMK